MCTTPRRGWEEAPSGAMVRGKFKAKSAFTDDDKVCLLLMMRPLFLPFSLFFFFEQQKHLEYEYSFAIGKDWTE